MDVKQIAQLCHECNRAYCEQIGDYSQVPWRLAAQWQQESAIKGVEFALRNPHAPLSAQHNSWMGDKVTEGWKYGPVKNAEKKEHPCLVPFDQLPLEQRFKDHLFRAVVNACQDGGLLASAMASGV